MKRERRKPTQADLRALGVRPGLQTIRYPPGEDRARVQQLTAEARGRPPLYRKTPSERREARPRDNECHANAT